MKVKSIKKLLRTLLQNGPLREREVWEVIDQAGYSFKSYHRARRAMHIESIRYGWGSNGYWEIHLPGRSVRRLPAVQEENRQSA